MGDAWDYRLRKMDMAWQLALRMIPQEPEATGRWTAESYLECSQEILKEAFKVIDGVFKEA